LEHAAATLSPRFTEHVGLLSIDDIETMDRYPYY